MKSMLGAQQDPIPFLGVRSRLSTSLLNANYRDSVRYHRDPRVNWRTVMVEVYTVYLHL